MSKHSEKCKVCNSPDRKEIERDYIRGISLREIEQIYPGVSSDSVWRHVQAFPALRKRRSENTEAILDRVIENGSIRNMKIDGHLLLKALQTKLKLLGKLADGARQGDVNVQVNVIQEGKEQLEKNRQMAYERLRYSSDN